MIELHIEQLDKLKIISIREEKIVKFLRIAITKVRFCFNNEVYTQNHEIATGSALETLGNILIGFTESI